MDIKFLTGSSEPECIVEKAVVRKVNVPVTQAEVVKFTHSFFTVENGIVTDFDFTDLKVDETPASAIFRVSNLNDT